VSVADWLAGRGERGLQTLNRRGGRGRTRSV